MPLSRVTSLVACIVLASASASAGVAAAPAAAESGRSGKADAAGQHRTLAPG